MADLDRRRTTQQHTNVGQLHSFVLAQRQIPIIMRDFCVSATVWTGSSLFWDVTQPSNGRVQMKYDGTRAETRFRLSAKRTSPFKSAGGASVHSTAGSRGVLISGSNAGYTVFRGSVKSTGYPMHSPVSPSLTLPCATVCHHISTGVL